MDAVVILVLLAMAWPEGHAIESTVYLSLDEVDQSQSCIYALSGDIADWVPKVSADPTYQVAIDPYCVDSATFQLGPLAADMSRPDVVISADRIDNGLMFFQTAPGGDIGVFFGGSNQVTGVAVDHQSQNVYFTDPEIGLVMLQNGVSNPYFDILLRNLPDPRGVVVDPDQGYIFWAESSVIKRASLVGTSVLTILTSVSSDALFAIDRGSRKLFVLDQITGTLKSMSYDGQSVKTLFSNLENCTSGTFAGLAADQGYVFAPVTDKATLMIWNEDNGDKMAEMELAVNNAKQFSISITNAVATPSTSTCAQNNGGCSHICVHQAGGSNTCKCSIGYALQGDGKTCKPGYLTDNFVLITDTGLDGIYQLDMETGSVHGVPTEPTTNQRIEAAVYDPDANLLIWIDTGNGTLRSKVLTDGSAELTLHTFDEASIVEGLAYDREGHHVYYVDNGLSQIGRISLDSGQEIVLSLSADELPLQIQVDPENGYMYWTNVGNSPTIERANMTDGSDRKTLVDSDIDSPTGLTLDVNRQLVYWVDAGMQRIEQISMSGTDRQMIAADTEAYTLAVNDTILYVARRRDVRKYALSEDAPSTLGPKVFSTLNGISLYSSGIVEDDDTSDRSALLTAPKFYTTLASCLTLLLQKLA